MLFFHDNTVECMILPGILTLRCRYVYLQIRSELSNTESKWLSLFVIWKCDILVLQKSLIVLLAAYSLQ